MTNKTADVPTVTLGDELTVSAIGFGAMALTPVYGEVDDTESLATLHRTVDLGGIEENESASSGGLRRAGFGQVTTRCARSGLGTLHQGHPHRRQDPRRGSFSSGRVGHDGHGVGLWQPSGPPAKFPPKRLSARAAQVLRAAIFRSQRRRCLPGPRLP